jgi:V-type H+-transporting ATPase subunit E
LAVADEFLKKEKDRDIAERIARSSELGSCRVKTMTVRDKLLQTLLEEASSKCAVVSAPSMSNPRSGSSGAAAGGGGANSNYPQLLQKLIVQGLIQIDETEVTIYTRASDVPIVQGLLAAAVQEYVALITRATGGVVLQPRVTINPDRTKDLPESTCGGVFLTARNGLITCDNTLKSRLNLVYEELLPAIRAILFPEEAK